MCRRYSQPDGSQAFEEIAEDCEDREGIRGRVQLLTYCCTLPFLWARTGNTGATLVAAGSG